MQAIEIVGLEKVYAKGLKRLSVRAIDGISLSVTTGEVFGFVGPNGAGKSSTIRILMGLARPTRGTVRLFGVDAGEPAARSKVGYVPENPYLYDYLTPREILGMSLNLHGSGGGNSRGVTELWLERLRIRDVADSPIRSFSKGMTQRVALAQAMCIQPRLLVLDEPLSGLDPIGRREVVDLLGEYKRQGGTLFFTSHVLHDVERLADRFGLIHKGKLYSVRSPAELVDGADMVVVRVSGDGELPGWRRETAGRWVAELARANLWIELENLRSCGFDIVEILPTLSLEAAFMRAVAESQIQGGSA